MKRDPAKLKICCPTHGVLPWRFTLECGKCGAVYQAKREGVDFIPVCPGAAPSPKYCACGSLLPGEAGTARAICTDCFISRVQSVN